MTISGHHSMMETSSVALPYKRQVEYIDTNGGGCTTDIVCAPVYGYRTKGRISVITPSGNIIFGCIRSPSDYDNRGSRVFFSYFNNHYVAWQDMARLRIRTSASAANAFVLDTFFDFDFLSQSTRVTSFLKIDNINLMDSYEPRNKTPIEAPFSICKESQADTVYGRVKIASLTIMQGDEIIADFLPVETFSGEAGLYNPINGTIYTSTAGNSFALPSANGGGGGYKLRCTRRSYRCSLRPSARFWRTSCRWEVAA